MIESIKKIVEDATDTLDHLAHTKRSYVFNRSEIEQVIIEAIEDSIKELLRQGMGKSPVDPEFISYLKSDVKHFNELNTSWHALEEHLYKTIAYIKHLECRIGFLSQDNESWSDGYRQGLSEGRRRAIDAVKNMEEVHLYPCELLYILEEKLSSEP